MFLIFSLYIQSFIRLFPTVLAITSFITLFTGYALPHAIKSAGLAGRET
jgi:hypothetical protein